MNIMNIISNIVNNPKNIIGLIFFVILMVYHYVFDNFLLRESFINELSFVGSNNSNIRHLNSIQNSNIIKGDLSIINTDFKDLSFLKTITEIQGNLDIYENMDLTSLKGLSNLKKVGGYWFLISNILFLIYASIIGPISEIGIITILPMIALYFGIYIVLVICIPLYYSNKFK